ncbi:MAG: peptidoglycan DD-metalloendopeptidase family protein [Azospirillaceae bacterium]
MRFSRTTYPIVIATAAAVVALAAGGFVATGHHQAAAEGVAARDAAASDRSAPRTEADGKVVARAPAPADARVRSGSGQAVRAAMAVVDLDAARPADDQIPFLTRDYRPGGQVGALTPRELDLVIEPGDTLMALLTDAGVDRTEAHYAIEALGELVDLRRLQIGQEISLTLEGSSAAPRLASLQTMPDVETVARVRWDEEADGFVAGAEENRLDTRTAAAAGEIDASLYLTARDRGVPDQIIIEALKAYAYTVDFQRDIREGDRFEILYEQEYHADGRFARNGNILYAELTLQGRELPIYLFEHGDGRIDYYDRDGESMRRVLMRTPVDGARLSSSFGPRRHPIKGYTRMHAGTDFAAPTGTPIYAAGDGVIEMIGRNGGYGNYVRLRHNGSLKTAYAHMNGFAKGLGQGDRVRQGDVIGYIGSTGLSTGPHLHYEVHMDGAKVNPMSIDLPTGENLAGTELAAFRERMADLDRLYAQRVADTQFAARPDTD